MAKAKTKYYAVRKGKTPGIYKTWDECKENVHGFSGAIYKSFNTLEEAEEFLKADKDPWWDGYDYSKKADKVSKTVNSITSTDAKNTAKPASAQTSARTDSSHTSISSDELISSVQPVRSITPTQGSNRDALIKYLSGIQLSDAIAFVDGSYNIATKEYSYGMLIYHDGELYEAAECYNNEEMSTMRNVAGELEGAMHAMSYCIEHGIESLDLYYDYEGIEKWASGSWKTNKSGTKAYKIYYDSIEDTLAVNFVKVKGHSGDLGNERADELAKQAAGV